ncbi:MAG: 1,2-diacylglycerol 3-glucosyltransferase [Herpetosiphonaceae bacterium]|nr:MAG: 1,2-diacylglycerol 3-glucosyltransferase [Herpetosiphonaceae bacterium]
MLNYEYPPLGGGASPITGALAQQLAAAGHQVDVVTMSFRGLPRYESQGCLRVFRVPSWRRSQVSCSTPEMLTYLLPALWRSLRLHKETRYDLIHAHFIIPTSPVGAALRTLHRLPLVVTIHGSDVPGYNPDRFRLGHRLLRPAWRWLARQADALISPSAYLRDLLQTHIQIPVTLIPYGFDSAPPPLVERRRRILAASRLFPRKGIQYLLEALEGIDLEGWEVVIAGDGPSRGELEEQARRLGLPVRFAGFVKGQSLIDLYAGSEIFVFPSLRDNFPVVLLEAMSAGCAVIASNVTGIPEVVGEAGVLVPPANAAALREALLALMRDPVARRRYGEAAQAHIRRFSWPLILAQHESLYRHVLSRPSSSSGARRS